jgi:hypothetical protein
MHRGAEPPPTPQAGLAHLPLALFAAPSDAEARKLQYFKWLCKRAPAENLRRIMNGPSQVFASHKGGTRGLRNPVRKAA